MCRFAQLGQVAASGAVFARKGCENDSLLLAQSRRRRIQSVDDRGRQIGQRFHELPNIPQRIDAPRDPPAVDILSSPRMELVALDVFY